MPPIRSDLPIVSPDPPRRSAADRYGSAYYLGLAGLAAVVALIAWFGLGLWSLRGDLAAVYRLHDPSRADEARIDAALTLAESPRTTQRQCWGDALDRRLPTAARYLMAEALTSEAATGDPVAYAASVARSEGWPAWLRLLLVRPIAYAAASGSATFPPGPISELRSNPDPAVGLWAAYVQAVSGDRDARADLDRVGGDLRPLARLLIDALDGDADDRIRDLDRATAWVRANHPDARAAWAGWEVADGRIRRHRPAAGAAAPAQGGS